MASARPLALVALAVVVVMMMATQAAAAAAEPEYKAHPYDPACPHHKHGKHGGCKHGDKPDPEPVGCTPDGENAPTEVCGTELIAVGASCATAACGNGADSQTTYTCQEDGTFATVVGQCTRCVSDDPQVLAPCNDIAVGAECTFSTGVDCFDGTVERISVFCEADLTLSTVIFDCPIPTCTPTGDAANACGTEPVSVGSICESGCGEQDESQVIYTCEPDGSFSTETEPCGEINAKPAKAAKP